MRITPEQVNSLRAETFLRTTEMGSSWVGPGAMRAWEEGKDPNRLIAFEWGAYALPDRPTATEGNG